MGVSSKYENQKNKNIGYSLLAVVSSSYFANVNNNGNANYNDASCGDGGVRVLLMSLQSYMQETSTGNEAVSFANA